MEILYQVCLAPALTGHDARSLPPSLTSMRHVSTSPDQEEEKEEGPRFGGRFINQALCCIPRA